MKRAALFTTLFAGLAACTPQFERSSWQSQQAPAIITTTLREAPNALHELEDESAEQELWLKLSLMVETRCFSVHQEDEEDCMLIPTADKNDYREFLTEDHSTYMTANRVFFNPAFELAWSTYGIWKLEDQGVNKIIGGGSCVFEKSDDEMVIRFCIAYPQSYYEPT